MKSAKKLIVILLALCMIVTVFSACGESKTASAAPESAQQAEPAPASNGKLYLNIGTGPSTGMYYPYGTAMGELWMKYIDNISVTAQATNAGAHNITLMDSGDVDIGFCVSNVTGYAVDGVNSFDGNKHSNLRAGAYFMNSVIQFVVRNDSGITDVKDLVGKRFIPGANNSGCEICVREIFDALGITYDDMSVEFVNFDGAVERLSNGQADAAVIFSSVPVSSMMQLCSTADCHILGLTQDEIDQVIKAYPTYAAMNVAAGTYDNQPEDALCVYQANWIIYDESLPEDVAYQMTKLLYENTDELIEMCSAAKAISVERTKDVIETLPCALHPGVEKYFKEVGIID